MFTFSRAQRDSVNQFNSRSDSFSHASAGPGLAANNTWGQDPGLANGLLWGGGQKSVHKRWTLVLETDRMAERPPARGSNP